MYVWLVMDAIDRRPIKAFSTLEKANRFIRQMREEFDGYVKPFKVY